MALDLADPLLTGRNETPLQRCDRNLVELLQEMRVVQTGVQVLFAFLLIAPLSAGFGEVGTRERIEYFASLAAAGGAATVLMVPTAYHRILFRLGDKEHLVAVANRCTLAGLALVGAAMLGSLLFVSDLLFGVAAAAVTVAIALAAHLERAGRPVEILHPMQLLARSIAGGSRRRLPRLPRRR